VTSVSSTVSWRSAAARVSAVEAQLTEEDRRGQRMLHVGLPGEPELPGVSPLGHDIGALQHRTVGLGEVGGPGREIGVGMAVQRVYRGPRSRNREADTRPSVTAVDDRAGAGRTQAGDTSGTGTSGSVDPTDPRCGYASNSHE